MIIVISLKNIPGMDWNVTFAVSKINRVGFAAIFQVLEESTIIQNSPMPSNDSILVSDDNTGHHNEATNGVQNSDSKHQTELILDADYDINGLRDNDSITTILPTHKECYGRDGDNKAMFHNFWLHVMEIIDKHPSHDHSQQWQLWILNGLSQQSGLADIKRVMGIDTKSQLFLILHDSPALNTTYDISWDHKMQYSLKPTKDDNFCLTNVLSDKINLEKKNDTFCYQSNTYTAHFLDDHDTEFLVLHKMAYKIIQEWAVEHTQMDNNWMQWKKWTFAGVKAIQPAQQIKKILQVNNIFDYVKRMIKFPVFRRHLT
jgi:hypothetical protein